MEDVTVVTTDNWQTVSVSGSQTAPVLSSLSLQNGTLSLSFSGTTTSYTTTQTGQITLLASAESASYSVTAVCNGSSQSLSGSSATFYGVENDDYIYITVNNGGTGAYATRTYTIHVVAASGLSEES